MVHRLCLLVLGLVLWAGTTESQAAPATQCVTTAMAGGTGDVITVPALPCVPTTALLILTFSASNTTTAPTLQPVGATALPIQNADGSVLVAGQLYSGLTAALTDTGSVWKLIPGVPATDVSKLTVLPTGGTTASTLANLLGRVNGSATLSLGSTYAALSSSIYDIAAASGTIATGKGLPVLPSGTVFPLNYMACSDTLTAPTGSLTNPLIAACHGISYTGLGTGTGDRAGLGVEMTISGSTAQTEGNAFFNGIIVTTSAQSNLGGTLGTEVGDIYGVSTQTFVGSNATHLASVHGAGEWDLKVLSGASLANKIGAEINLISGDAVQGSNIDTAFLFDDLGSTTWKRGITFGLPSGQGGSFPISGTIIGSYVGGSPTEGIDFGNIAATDCTFKSPNVCFDGSGHIDIINNVGRAPTCSSTGTGTGASCATESAGFSSDSAGLLFITTGTSPGSSGTLTITFSPGFGGGTTNGPACIMQGWNGTGSWTAPLTFITTAGSPTAVTVAWTAGAALTASQTYGVQWHCFGRS